MRDDLLLQGLAEELGYRVVPEERVGDPVVFVRGDKHVWYCHKGWACAELKEGHYTNHRYHEELEDALREGGDNGY